MRVLLQVVKNASVSVDGNKISKIGKGFLLFVGFNNEDNEEIMKKTIDKAIGLRIFPDENGKTNLSLKDVGGEILCVSQFTLYADYKKGKRPSFVNAMRGEFSKPLYDLTCEYIEEQGYLVKKGIFGADMKISLINDGPFTIMVDSKEL